MGQLQRPETHDMRPGMGTVSEMWRYRLAQRVRGLRLLYGDDGLSQRELARRLKVNHTLVQRVEAGEGCAIELLVKLSTVFGVSTDFLLGRAKVPESHHELVDRAYERTMSVASSLDFVREQGDEITIRQMLDFRDMLRGVQRDFVDLAHRFRYPNQDDLSIRTPYGYEFVKKMEGKLGHDLDR